MPIHAQQHALLATGKLCPHIVYLSSKNLRLILDFHPSSLRKWLYCMRWPTYKISKSKNYSRKASKRLYIRERIRRPMASLASTRQIPLLSAHKERAARMKSTDRNRHRHQKSRHRNTQLLDQYLWYTLWWTAYARRAATSFNYSPGHCSVLYCRHACLQKNEQNLCVSPSVQPMLIACTLSHQV